MGFLDIYVLFLLVDDYYRKSVELELIGEEIDLGR